MGPARWPAGVRSLAMRSRRLRWVLVLVVLALTGCTSDDTPDGPTTATSTTVTTTTSAPITSAATPSTSPSDEPTTSERFSTDDVPVPPSRHGRRPGRGRRRRGRPVQRLRPGRLGVPRLGRPHLPGAGTWTSRPRTGAATRSRCAVTRTSRSWSARWHPRGRLEPTGGRQRRLAHRHRHRGGEGDSRRLGGLRAVLRRRARPRAPLPRLRAVELDLTGGRRPAVRRALGHQHRWCFRLGAVVRDHPWRWSAWRRSVSRWASTSNPRRFRPRRAASAITVCSSALATPRPRARRWTPM